MAFRKILLAGLAAVGLFGSAALPVQAEKSYVIEHYDVRLVLEDDGAYAVRETLDFDFRGEPFTFAYREIRLRGIDRIDGLEVRSDDVQIRRVEEKDSSSRHSLRWEFPDRLGRTRFVLTYRAEGALLASGERNRIDWDAVGRNWDVPIGEVTVTLFLPESLRLKAEDVAFQPADEGTLHATRSEGAATGWEIRYRYSSLAPETAYRVIVDFPQRLEGREPSSPGPSSKTVWGGVFAMLVGLLPGLALIGRFGGPRVPPGDGSEPDVALHEAAVLLHPSSPYAERGFVATVFDLARRGHVRLVRRRKGRGWLQPTKTYLEALGLEGDGQISEFEKDLLGRLQGRQSLEDFGRKDRDYRRRKVAALRRDLIARGWLQDRTSDGVRALLLGFAGLAIGVAVLVGFGGVLGWAIGGLLIGLSFGWQIAKVRFLPPSEEGARKRAAIVARVEHLQEKVEGHLEIGDESRAAERWLEFLPWLTLKPKPSLISKLVRQLKKSEARLNLPGWARDESERRSARAAAAFVAFEPYLLTCRSTAGAIAPTSGASSSSGAGAGAGGGAGGGGGGAG